MLESLKSVYTDFILKLENAVEEERISAYYGRTILNMSKKFLENIAAKYGTQMQHYGTLIHNSKAVYKNIWAGMTLIL